MIERLINWDIDLFLYLNQFHNGFWDVIMFYFSEKWIWIPLYLLFIAIFIKRYRRQAIWIVLAIIAVIGLSDFVSVNLFKNVFLRLRPCHNPTLEGLVHIVRNHCGGQYGFYSSHASNHFAIAIFVSLILQRKISKGWIFGIILWAAVVSYSRIYLGVHYPGDIVAGAIAGTVLAYIGYRTLRLLQPTIH